MRNTTLYRIFFDILQGKRMPPKLQAFLELPSMLLPNFPNPCSKLDAPEISAPLFDKNHGLILSF